jgi:hypothetical protein
MIASYIAQINFPATFASQGVSRRMPPWLDGAIQHPEYFGKSFENLKNLMNLEPTKSIKAS